MSPDALTVALALIGTVAVVLVVDSITHRRQYRMSQSAELSAAVNGLATAVQALATALPNLTANFTPDADVAAAVTGVNAATAQIQSLTPPPPAQP
jgi:hypothetical protein